MHVSTLRQNRHWLFFWLATLTLTGIGLAKGIEERAKDYHVYDLAAERFLEGKTLYVESDRPMPFKYPPPAVLLFVPLGVSARPIGGALLNLLSVACFVLVVARLKSSASEASIAVLCLFQSLFLIMDHGQVDLAILALLVLAYQLASDRPILAGIAWGIACLLKPPAGLLLFAFARYRRYRAIAAAALTGVAGCTLVAARYGSETLALFGDWRTLLGGATETWILRHDAQGWPTAILSFASAAGIFDGNPTGFHLAIAQLFSLAIFLGLYAWRRPAGDEELAWLALGVALLSPQAWRANFVLALPAVVIAVRRWRSGSRRALLALSILALVQLVFGEGILPDRYLDPALATLRPFALAFSLLWVPLLEGSEDRTVVGSAISRAPRR